MTKPNSEYQKDHRRRRAIQRQRMIDGLKTIVTELDGNDKPTAVRIRQIAIDALKEG